MGSKATSRDVPTKISTQIWADVTDASGQKTTLCHGYDFFGDLLGRYSWTELVFLLLKGELPDKRETALLERIMTGIMNPGPKAWETNSAMAASVTQTPVGNMMMAGVAALQGRYNGGLCVESSMAMLRTGMEAHAGGKGIGEVSAGLETTFPDLPGFGLNRGKRDDRARAIMDSIKEDRLGGDGLDFAGILEVELSGKKNIWLTPQGVAAAVFLDLGFGASDGHGLYILSAMPGILAHGLEQRKKGYWNTFPFYEAPKYTPESIRTVSGDQSAYRPKEG